MTRIIRSTVTSKGQITLPKAVRDHLRATRGTQLEFVLDENGVTVRNSALPETPWEAWFGIAPLPEGQSVDDWIRDMRDQDEAQPPSEPQPGQHIIYLLPDGTERQSIERHGTETGSAETDSTETA